MEQKNCALEDMSKTMLLKNGLPKTFWAKTVNTANYVLNRCFITTLLKKTPYDLFKGRKPYISYFKSFGCTYSIHNDGEDNLGKFDAHSDEAIFLGYAINSKSYRVFNLRTKVVEESIHVIFDETDNGILSEGFADPKLSHDDDEDETSKENETNMQENILTLNVASLETNNGSQGPDNFNKESDPSEQVQNYGNSLNKSQGLELKQKASLLILKRKFKQAFSHPEENIIIDLQSGAQTTSNSYCDSYGFVFLIEPKTRDEALQDAEWIVAMQNELNEYERKKVWILGPIPNDRTII